MAEQKAKITTLSGLMTDFPRSLLKFQQRFGDEAACAQYLAAARWPEGFVYPGCGGGQSLAAGDQGLDL